MEEVYGGDVEDMEQEERRCNHVEEVCGGDVEDTEQEERMIKLSCERQ